MADKTKLDELLTQDFARPPIRRGQGVTLSTQVEADADPTAEPDAQTHKRTNAQTAVDAAPVQRVSQGQRLRVDLIRALKQIALDDGRKLYQVMEEAIEDYIERRRRHGQ